MRDPQVTSKIMSKIRSSGSKAEKLLGKSMWGLGLRYRSHYPMVGKPDYIFLRAKIAVFCDGDFWHGRDFWEKVLQERFKHNKEYWIQKIQRNIARDKNVNNILEGEGWLVMRFWETDILKSPMMCAEAVLKMYQERLMK
jgi:DNA mismatch endonuclease (patch repair protein)